MLWLLSVSLAAESDSAPNIPMEEITITAKSVWFTFELPVPHAKHESMTCHISLSFNVDKSIQKMDIQPVAPYRCSDEYQIAIRNALKESKIRSTRNGNSPFEPHKYRKNLWIPWDPTFADHGLHLLLHWQKNDSDHGALSLTLLQPNHHLK